MSFDEIWLNLCPYKYIYTYNIIHLSNISLLEVSFDENMDGTFGSFQ